MEFNRKNFASLLLFFLLSLLLYKPSSAHRKSYVVYIGEHSQTTASRLTREQIHNSHSQMLASVLGSSEKAQDSIFYSYTNYINGFAARLEEEEAIEISKRPEVISVFPNKAYKLHTTRSWDFLGLDDRVLGGSLWEKARFGEGTIIGNLDTGVWPESQSFNDEDIGPIPLKWKGTCEMGITCNRKLIGARYFNKGFLADGGQVDPDFNSPRDAEGHGTHTLSTAAGRFVRNANVFGYGNGTVKGGSPNAHVAAYKVCWPTADGEGTCYDADILAAFDVAIHDGVDVLSASLGTRTNFFEDGLAIGSFHATKNGISVVCSAGNDGPTPGSVANVAPWVLTVRASTMDREFTTYLALDNKLYIKGQSLSRRGSRAFHPIISSTSAAASNKTNAQLCLPESLDPNKVKGKIVVCLRGENARVEKGYVVLKAGGVGMVLANDAADGNESIADAHVLPAIHISYSDGVTVFSHLKNTKSPYGFLTTPKTNVGVKPAPVMASFSSRGPNRVIPEILKPDITAPGVDVLAAYTEAASPTNIVKDTRRIPFNVVSGTSMSCPHIAGVVGLLKTLHPDWGPSAIKSAIMTTAMTQDNMQAPITNTSSATATPFSYGSGHVQPNSAMDPGLVYDLTPTDYLNFLCSIGFNSSQMKIFNGETHSCPSKPLKHEDLNYPSITIPSLSGNTTIARTLKNVGSSGTYVAQVVAPRGIEVSVTPASLTFAKVGEEKSFEVNVRAKKSVGVTKDYAFGTLTWSDGKHYVKSPIAVKIGKQ